MDIARAARAHSAERIHVGSIPYRAAVPKVNDLLYMCCLAENFVFMDQSDISLAHIDSDGIHPNF